MRYETTQKYYIKLRPKYHTKQDQQKLIDLRVIASNQSDLIDAYTQFLYGEPTSDLAYFGVETHTVDINNPHNREILKQKYENHKDDYNQAQI